MQGFVQHGQPKVKTAHLLVRQRDIALAARVGELQ